MKANLDNFTSPRISFRSTKGRLVPDTLKDHMLIRRICGEPYPQNIDRIAAQVSALGYWLEIIEEQEK